MTNDKLREAVFNRPWLYAEGLMSPAQWFAGPWPMQVFFSPAEAAHEEAEERWRSGVWGCRTEFVFLMVQQDKVLRSWFNQSPPLKLIRGGKPNLHRPLAKTKPRKLALVKRR
jgi:hypothetical protein